MSTICSTIIAIALISFVTIQSIRVHLFLEKDEYLVSIGYRAYKHQIGRANKYEIIYISKHNEIYEKDLRKISLKEIKRRYKQ